jgi:hypothetical protein
MKLLSYRIRLRTAWAFGMVSLILVLTIAGMGQSVGDKSEMLDKVKQAAAANQQQLHQYTWTESRQITLNGNAKPAQQFQCEYGTDGRVQKTPMGMPASSVDGGGTRVGMLRQRIVEKKTEEIKDYMSQVQAVIALYVPPDSERMQRAFQLGNVSVNAAQGTKAAELVFKNYAQPGDRMTITFDTEAKKMRTLNVNTYLNDPKEIVTLAVQMAPLPDGTNYPQQTVLDAQAKQLQVTTTNSNYAKRMQ